MASVLLKVDLSGIQNFIFDVPGKKASRNLKGRSFFVQIITQVAEKYFKNISTSTEVLYNGGGNVIMYLDVDKDSLEQSILIFQKSFSDYSIFPSIAFVEIESRDNFFENKLKLDRVMLKAKLKQPVSFDIKAAAESGKYDEAFGEFTGELARAKGYNIESVQDSVLSVTENSISMAGFKVTLMQQEPVSFSFSGSLSNAMPIERGNILDFDAIAGRAISRGRDGKLAALKMDVDNLGNLFRGRKNEEFKILSKALDDFFTKTLYNELLEKLVENGDVYPVFAGGDDCFLIGAWDVMLVLSIEIQELFSAFQQNLQKNVQLDNAITISAGIVIFNPKYPMLRLVEEAEKALEEAKHFGKNRVSIFGEVITWEEFSKAAEFANTLVELIANGESRAILERIRSSQIGFQSLQQRIINTGKMEMPRIYRLKYYLRNAKKIEHGEILEKAFDNYADALLQDFIVGKALSNAAQFPVAARWAELLTKSNS